MRSGELICLSRLGHPDTSFTIARSLQFARRRASNNFGRNSCQNLDQKYGDAGDMDAISAINSKFYGFGPVGAIIACGDYDAQMCSSSSGNYSFRSSGSKVLDFVKYGVAYAMFGLAALILLATFEVVHKRRRRRKKKNLRISVVNSASMAEL